MDPNLFRLDWELLLEVLAVIIFLSFVVERALAPVFEHRLFVTKLKSRGLKEPIAVALAFTVCKAYGIDAMAVVLKADNATPIGFLITAAMIAGGSKASIRLFHDVLGAKSTIQKERDALAEIERSTVETSLLEASVKKPTAPMVIETRQ